MQSAVKVGHSKFGTGLGVWCTVCPYACSRVSMCTVVLHLLRNCTSCLCILVLKLQVGSLLGCLLLVALIPCPGGFRHTHTQTQHTLWLALAECLLKLNHSAMFLHIDADIAVCTCRHCAQATFKAGVYTLWFEQWCTISLPMLHLCMIFKT